MLGKDNMNKLFTTLMFITLPLCAGLHCLWAQETKENQQVSSITDQFFWAVENQDLITIETIHSHGFDINAKNKDGYTALIIASQKGHRETVQWLLNNGADVNVNERMKGTALVCASDGGYADIVGLLLAKGANVNDGIKQFGAAYPAVGDTPLMRAASKGHLEVVKLLIDNGAEIDYHGTHDETAVQDAVEGGHLSVIKYLVERGANLNCGRSCGGWSLFMSVAYYQNEDIIDYFLTQGFSVNDTVTDSMNLEIPILSWASFRGITKTVDILVNKGADVNLKDQTGRTALIYACFMNIMYIGLEDKRLSLDIEMPRMKGEEEKSAIAIIQILLGKGADINLCDKIGQTPLMYAAARGQIDLVKFLLDHGADASIKSINGKTALTFATEGVTYILKKRQ